MIVLFARMSSMRIPRTSTPSNRPFAVAMSGVSISGTADVTPGVFFAWSAICCQPFSRPSYADDDRMAVEADDLVEQLGAKAVHHAHDDDQCSNAERDRDQADAGDEEDEALALAGKQIASGEHPLGAIEDHKRSIRRGCRNAKAWSMLAITSTALSAGMSSRWPLRRFLVSIIPWATDFGPTMNCHGRPITSIEPSFTPPRSSRSSYSAMSPNC